VLLSPDGHSAFWTSLLFDYFVSCCTAFVHLIERLNGRCGELHLVITFRLSISSARIIIPTYHCFLFRPQLKSNNSMPPPRLDSVLISYKSFSSKQFELLQKSLIDYMGSKKEPIIGSKLGSNMGSEEQSNGGSDTGAGSGVGQSVSPLSWLTDIAPRPLYLLGR
jgi:hypothetical protein